MSLYIKLIRGASTNLIEHGLKVVVIFVTTPLMIRYLGVEDYGTWLLAIAIIAYFRMLDLGLTFAGSRFLGTTIGANDRAEYQSLASKLYRLYSLVGLAALALTLIVVWAMPLFIKDSGMVATVRILVAGFGVVTALRLFTRIYEVILKSHVRYDLIGISSILKTILQAGLVIGLLVSGYGLMALLMAHILIDVVDQILLMFLARRIESDLCLRKAGNGKVKTGELLRYSATAVATSFGSSLRQGIDPFIITHASGVTALPFYNVGVRFIGVFNDIMNAIFGGNFIAAFSQLNGRGDSLALKERLLQTIRYSTIVVTLGGCGIMIFGPAFILRWVGSEFEVSGIVLLILTPAMALPLCLYPVWSLLYSLNKQHWMVALTIGGGVLNLSMSLYFASRIGWIGVVWATCLETVFTYGLIAPWIVTRVCAISLKRFFWRMFVPAIIIIITSTLYWLAVRLYVEPFYDRLLLLGSGYLVVLGSAIWFVVLTKSERKALWGMAHHS